MRNNDLYHPVEYASAAKVKDVDPERAIRLYCTQSGSTWGLQVRTPERLRTGRDGKAFIVAHATLDRSAMIALRAAINKLLKED